MGEVCVERRIECLVDDEWRAGRIAVMQPELDGEDWRCELDLDWPGYKKSYPVMGVDAYQALELALRIVPVEIMASESFCRGQLRLYAEQDLLNEERLYKAFHAQPYGKPS